MATSTIPRGRIEVAARRGESLPVGWAIDADGRPARTPEAALAGALHPLGGEEATAGYKGYGLGLAVDLLTGVLSDADEDSLSHLDRQRIRESAYFLTAEVEVVDGHSGKTVVKIDPTYFRPTEVDLLIGDASKAREVLGWKPKRSFAQLVEEMVASDLAVAKREVAGGKRTI